MAFGAYGLYAVKYGSSSIGNIMEQSLNPGVSHLINTGSGIIDTKFAAVLQTQPTFGFSTTSINTAMTAIGINGAKIDASNKFTLYLEQLAHGGTKTGGSANYTLVMDDGIVYPVRISCGQNGLASISYMGHLADNAGDGGSPIAITASQALAGTPFNSEGYTIGDVTIGGATIAGIESIDIDYGINVITLPADGLAFPRHISIVQRNPTVTIRTIDPAILLVIGSGGDAQSESISSGAIVKLRTVTKNGTISTSTGISFTMTEGLSYLNPIGGRHGDAQSYEFCLHPTHDGTHDIIAYATY